MMRFLFLAAGMFAMGCDDYIFAGLLPGISTSLRASFASTAQGTVAFGIAFVGALPVCAFLLSRRPARHALLLALLTFIAGNLGTLFSANLVMYIASRAVAGLGAGLYLPVAVAAAVQLPRPGAKGEALSLIWGANSAGAVVGVPTGLWLAEKTSWHAGIGLILLLSVTALMGTLLQNLDLKLSAPPSLREQAQLLFDRGVMPVIGVTFVTAVGCLGLYAYIAPVLSGSTTSAVSALSLWNIGGLIGSLAIGYVVDRVGKPQWVMATILATLMATLLALSVGPIPFVVWGAMGWATVTPQLYSLSQIRPGRDAALVALNSSAVSLGSVVGAALGGLALAKGLNARNLPYAATGLLFFALAWQVLLIQRLRSETVS